MTLPADLPHHVDAMVSSRHSDRSSVVKEVAPVVVVDLRGVDSAVTAAGCRLLTLLESDIHILRATVTVAAVRYRYSTVLACRRVVVQIDVAERLTAVLDRFLMCVPAIERDAASAYPDTFNAVKILLSLASSVRITVKWRKLT
jgi:hypothetical protein